MDDDFTCQPPMSCFECPYEDCTNPTKIMTKKETEFYQACKEKKSKLRDKTYHVTLKPCVKSKILM